MGQMDGRDNRAELVAAKLAPWIIELYGAGADPTEPDAFGIDASTDPNVTQRELRRLASDGHLGRLLAEESPDPVQVERRLVELVRQDGMHARSADLLWATLAGEWHAVEAGGWRRSLARAVKRWIAVLSLLGVIAAVVGAAEWVAGAWSGSLMPLELFVVATLSFFPGWLFIRFVGFRAAAVWNEFVLNLHRLGIDETQHLPRPPTNSVYHARWVAAGGPLLARQPTIYQEKFDAYYGKALSRSRRDGVTTEAFFPMLLATAVLAVGWTAVLWGPDVFDRPPRNTADMLAFAFLGAYAFMVQMLIRRYFQGDLKASAYTASVARIFLAVGVVAVLQAADVWGAPRSGPPVAAAFVVGSFPLAGMQALQRAAAKMLKGVVPVLDFAHPLSDIEGLTIWYEARLLEEGIEDMQNLVTANLTEVMLHTRVPVGRLIDWIDQAHLFLRLPPINAAERKATNSTEPHSRFVLRRIGVRNATGFMAAFPFDGGLLPEADDAVDAVTGMSTMTRSQLATVARVLADEPGLLPVQRWRHWKDTLRETSVEPVIQLPDTAASTSSTTESASERISPSVRS